MKMMRSSTETAAHLASLYPQYSVCTVSSHRWERNGINNGVEVKAVIRVGKSLNTDSASFTDDWLNCFSVHHAHTHRLKPFVLL